MVEQESKQVTLHIMLLLYSYLEIRVKERGRAVDRYKDIEKIHSVMNESDLRSLYLQGFCC